ncbi:hypothetical protein T11_15131 [Trichinella zimbabwensis]|uniref:Uncharacterized protein n=1 Tax=Trichinella zimbabwensis TaxID=268475 RepID=A0A0V1H204_9BILA|nr:hypothetical protein T11_15131 [Trichinella zimbabwensis]
MEKISSKWAAKVHLYAGSHLARLFSRDYLHERTFAFVHLRTSEKYASVNRLHTISIFFRTPDAACFDFDFSWKPMSSQQFADTRD